jgi:hypothetical protein
LEVKTVRPSECRTTEVDLEVTGSPMDSLVIEVSEDDLEYWLGQQGAAQPEDAPAIERRPRSQWKQIAVKKAIAELWPNGIPVDLVNGQIEQRVGERLKHMGAPAISRDTILRAAGRK